MTPRPSWARSAMACSSPGRCAGSFSPSLSGGEKTRVNLGRLILEDTDILLLDEPTNHLDLRATEWLEEYLDRFKGTVLAISHDRWFLDRVVKRVIEIQEGKAEFYAGNYSFYAEEKERRYEREAQAVREGAGQDRAAPDRGGQAPPVGLHGQRQAAQAGLLHGKADRAPAQDRQAQERRKLDMRFGERDFQGDEVLLIKGLEKGFEGRALFHDVDLLIEGGERIALLGDNGAGKSTFLKLIMGRSSPTGASSAGDPR